jgi:hypothetical protein
LESREKNGLAIFCSVSEFILLFFFKPQRRKKSANIIFVLGACAVFIEWETVAELE